LEILEQVGLQVKSKTIIEVFKKGGADVDEEKNRVRIPVAGILRFPGEGSSAQG